jgi:transcriptional regulator with XRE-family HTH domain
MNWIEEVKRFRDNNSLSDAQTAHELGVSKQFLSDVLAGKKPLSAKLKMKVWALLGHDLDDVDLLAFFPAKVATELQEMSNSVSTAVPLQRPIWNAKHDWVDELLALRASREMTDTELASDLNVSQPFLSAVLNRKKPISWPLKIAIWGRRHYDLSRDTLLKLLPPDTAEELIKLDRQRGKSRAKNAKSSSTK